MDALVGAYAELGRFSGAVLVSRGSRQLFKKGYGHADHEHGVARPRRSPRSRSCGCRRRAGSASATRSTATCPAIRAASASRCTTC
jgi:hypothetical protein